MSKTLENLAASFVTETLAKNRYEIYAKVAKKEGYLEISDIFTETSRNEFYHAKALFKMMKELAPEMDQIETPATIPLTYGSTVENLKTAIAGEHEEGQTLYPEQANTADEEGYPEIAARLRNIGLIEDHHEKRYQAVLDLLEDGKFFNRDEPVTWVCRNCGFVYEGEVPPTKCPICEHPQSYFEREPDLW